MELTAEGVLRMIMTQLYDVALGQTQEKEGTLTVYRAAYRHLAKIRKTMTYTNSCGTQRDKTNKYTKTRKQK